MIAVTTVLVLAAASMAVVTSSRLQSLRLPRAVVPAAAGARLELGEVTAAGK